jgi:hypothetical protein
LLFAVGADAETKTGEATSPVASSLPGEGDLLAATASYDSTSGSARFEITTREAPIAGSKFFESGTLLKAKGPCILSSIESEGFFFPAFGIAAEYRGEWETQTLTFQGPEELETRPGVRSVSGATVVLTGADPKVIGQLFDCAVVGVERPEEGGEMGLKDVIAFPIAAPPPVVLTPPTPAAPAPSSSPTPAPGPAVLSIAGAKKPLKLRGEGFRKVKVTVTNTGGTASAAGQLKVKAPKGVVLKPSNGKLALPVIAPGRSVTVFVKVELTEDAKAKSTLSLSGTAGTLRFRSSLVVDLAT